MSVVTPWGFPQDTTIIAEGITLYSTASHGGIKLSPQRNAVLKKKYPNFVPFCGKEGWYEEDCDVSLVVVTFPECFEKGIVEQHRKHVNSNSYFQNAL